jgi:hypothetical protein
LNSERLNLKILYSSRLHHEALFPISFLSEQNFHSILDAVGLRTLKKSIINFSIFVADAMFMDGTRANIVG